MKTLHIHEGAVYYSEQEKPDEMKYAAWFRGCRPMKRYNAYHDALKQFHDSLIPVKNAIYCHLNKCWIITRPHPEYRWEIKGGEQCEVDENDNITKII